MFEKLLISYKSVDRLAKNQRDRNETKNGTIIVRPAASTKKMATKWKDKKALEGQVEGKVRIQWANRKEKETKKQVTIEAGGMNHHHETGEWLEISFLNDIFLFDSFFKNIKSLTAQRLRFPPINSGVE